MNDDGDVVRVVKGCCAAIECIVIEVPFWRGELPDELRKITLIFLVSGLATFSRKVKLIPPLELGLRG
jgi:hypothetical protein